jgi:bifunctional polynucleotide phosphatase/kinase
MDKWIITEKYVIGYDSSIIEHKFKKIHLFDLDYTIVKPKSGKRFPIDENDWMFLTNNVQETINKLEFCGIISNQNGLNNKEKIDKWITKIKNISKQINIKFVCCSIKTSSFRKPMDGSWKYLKDELLLNTNIPKLLKNNKIYYIGDASGRKYDDIGIKNDFSDTDLKFALNCNFIFKLPEDFFDFGTIQKYNITYPDLNYYSNEKYTKLIEKLFKQINKYIEKNENIIIMTIGLPASGKSFMRKLILEKIPEFKYFNSDDIKKKINNNQLIKKHTEVIKQNITLFIDDNTNLNFDKRNDLLQKFNNYKKIAIIYDYNMDLCMHLNYMRMYWFGYEPISKVTYYTMKKKSPDFIDQDFDSQFDYSVKINKLLPQYDITDNLKFFY